MSRPAFAASLRYAVPVTFAAAILVASVVDPGDGVPRTVLGIGTTVYLHVVGYAALAAALGYAARSADWRPLLAAAAVAALYGAGIEALQGPIPYRTMSAADAMTNAVGAALGTGAWRLLARRLGARFGADGG
ncbi:VanZ family protein [Natronomonas gomsonensis]|uniref:VanZ family protein n=1 Tax=Natronomonas gomsonensis TaxID=1046043 RepID=UPI00227C6016|nr:VanZ family protein [Natronomonas gomsonensis]MCY4732619.1 VanZ family protein [Natronomonas gomsonensis]